MVKLRLHVPLLSFIAAIGFTLPSAHAQVKSVKMTPAEMEVVKRHAANPALTPGRYVDSADMVFDKYDRMGRPAVLEVENGAKITRIANKYAEYMTLEHEHARYPAFKYTIAYDQDQTTAQMLGHRLSVGGKTYAKKIKWSPRAQIDTITEGPLEIKHTWHKGTDVLHKQQVFLGGKMRFQREYGMADGRAKIVYSTGTGKVFDSFSSEMKNGRVLSVERPNGDVWTYTYGPKYYELAAAKYKGRFGELDQTYKYVYLKTGEEREAGEETVNGRHTTTAKDTIKRTSKAAPRTQKTPLVFSQNGGNVVSDGRSLFVSDGSSQLCHVVQTNQTTWYREAYEYDMQGRRIVRETWTDGDKDGTWDLLTRHFTYYDEWLPVMEVVYYKDKVYKTIRYYWGPDIAGANNGGNDFQGMAGIRGFVAASVTGRDGKTTWLGAITDHNGTVQGLLDLSTYKRLHFLTSPWGERYLQAGEASLGKDVHIRFQSKMVNSRTGLIYFGKRYFHIASSQWMCRPSDPGSFGFVMEFEKNDPVNKLSPLGE